MGSIYYQFLGIAGVAAVLTTYQARKRASDGSSASGTAEFGSFQLIYLTAYCLAMFGDWFQGSACFA